METQFYLTVTLKTREGLDSFARFYIGNDRDRAFAIFEQLKGTREVSETDVLYIDFLETKEGLPLNLDMITCTLNQLAENCRIITKEFFKFENLEDS